jgi:hypothetical protein
MNDESSFILLSKLKRNIRSALEKADSEPRAAMIELRLVLEEAVTDVFRRTKEQLPAASRADPSIELSKGRITRLLKDAGVLPRDIADCAFKASEYLNAPAHSGSVQPTGSDVILPLKHLLRVLRWYEHEYVPMNSGTGVDGDKGQRLRDTDGPFKETTVILPRQGAGSDAEYEWRKIYNMLLSDGVTVISEPVPLTDPKAPSVLLVQVFGTLDRLEGVKLELEKWGISSVSDRVLQWRKTLPNPRIDSEILTSLDDDDKTFCETARTGSFEEFVLQVRSRLERDNSRRKITFLYLTFDRSNSKDDSYADMLVSAARERGAYVKVIPAKNQKRDFISALKKVTGFVFLYGDTNPSFIDEWIGNYIEGKLAMKANVGLAALYQAPPDREEMKAVQPKVGLPAREWRRYGSREEFKPDDIHQYCAELDRDGA